VISLKNKKKGWGERERERERERVRVIKCFLNLFHTYFKIHKELYIQRK
jgi:hypothetical protein